MHSVDLRCLLTSKYTRGKSNYRYRELVVIIWDLRMSINMLRGGRLFCMSRTTKNNSRIPVLVSTGVVRIIAEDHARQPHLGRNIIAPSLMSYGSLIAKLSKSASSDDDNLHRNNTTNEVGLDANPEFLLPLPTRDTRKRNRIVTIHSLLPWKRSRSPHRER